MTEENDEITLCCTTVPLREHLYIMDSGIDALVASRPTSTIFDKNTSVRYGFTLLIRIQNEEIQVQGVNDVHGGVTFEQIVVPRKMAQSTDATRELEASVIHKVKLLEETCLKGIKNQQKLAKIRKKEKKRSKNAKMRTAGPVIADLKQRTEQGKKTMRTAHVKKKKKKRSTKKRKRQDVCEKLIPGCNHHCSGLRDEEKCSGDCMICNTSNCGYCLNTLAGDPVIKLSPCGHLFHLKCKKEHLEKKWPTLNISFSFLNCIICQQPATHPEIDAKMQQHRKEEQEVTDMAVAQLKEEGLSAKVPKEELADLAMRHYLYFMCSKCDKPFCGGARSCSEMIEDRDPNENLMCLRCATPDDFEECKTHPPDYRQYKCRFCCNTALYFCWGKVHFCEDCDQKRVYTKLINAQGENKCKIQEYSQCPGIQDKIKKVVEKYEPGCSQSEMMGELQKLRGDPASCPLKVSHSPNGIEYPIGCQLCLLVTDANVSEQEIKTIVAKLDSAPVYRCKYCKIYTSQKTEEGLTEFVIHQDFCVSELIARRKREKEAAVL